MRGFKGFANQGQIGLGPAKTLNVPQHEPQAVNGDFFHDGPQVLVVRRAQGPVLGDNVGG